MVKRREKTKQEQLHLSIEIFEKRYQARDFSGHLLNEYTSNAVKSAAARYLILFTYSFKRIVYSYLSVMNPNPNRPAFAPIYANQYSHSSSSVAQSSSLSWAGNHHQFLAQQYHSVTAGANIKREDVASGCSGRKEKRQYKKRKHKTTQRDKPYPSPGNIFFFFSFARSLNSTRIDEQFSIV